MKSRFRFVCPLSVPRWASGAVLVLPLWPGHLSVLSVSAQGWLQDCVFLSVLWQACCSSEPS